VSHVATTPAYRWRGVARSLMAALLADHGRRLRTSLLLAIPMGAGLYQRLGYQTLARILSYDLVEADRR
jgi:predicted acetyltransferase